MATKYMHMALEELGLKALWSSTRDVKLLCIQRFVRMFAYGGSTIILVAFLSILGVSKTKVGLFMSLTLVGDTLISFFLTLFADGLGRRAILAMGALLMICSGITFATSRNYWILLLAAVLGVISPSGNEIGPFRAIEESTLAQLTPSGNRSDIYAWYSLIGTSGVAFGMIFSGWMTQYMRSDLGWNTEKAYAMIFWAYAVVGAIKFVLAISLSSACEAEKKKQAEDRNAETTPLLADRDESEPPKKSTLRSLIPGIGSESRILVLSLCLMLGLDAFASSLVSPAWVTYFFHDKFDLEEGKLGSLFFTTSIISAGSMLVASSIAKRFGNIKTMCFTHLPSSLFLAFIPAPSSLPLAMAFLILRSCTSSMDVAPRSAFLAAVIPSHERTAVMGLINVVKTCAQSIGPLITGVLAGNNLFWISFVMAGSLKVIYDLSMLALFASQKTAEERAEEQSSN